MDHGGQEHHLVTPSISLPCCAAAHWDRSPPQFMPAWEDTQQFSKPPWIFHDLMKKSLFRELNVKLHLTILNSSEITVLFLHQLGTLYHLERLFSFEFSRTEFPWSASYSPAFWCYTGCHRSNNLNIKGGRQTTFEKKAYLLL